MIVIFSISSSSSIYSSVAAVVSIYYFLSLSLSVLSTLSVPSRICNKRKRKLEIYTNASI